MSIEIEGLEFRYGGHGHLLHDVTFQVTDNELCCLLGPNGAGKTTLLRCVLGLLKPTKGRIRIGGVDTTGLSARELARAVAYVPQNVTTPFPFTAQDIVVMGRTPHLSLLQTPGSKDRKAALDILDMLGISHLADRPFTQLSGGERQLTLMGRALMQESQVLILDEPTAALDFGNEVRILNVINGLARDGRSILMTTHQPNHALICANRTVLMKAGRVVREGPSSEVVSPETLSDLYGVEVRMISAGMPDRSLQACVPVLAGMLAAPEIKEEYRNDSHLAH